MPTIAVCTSARESNVQALILFVSMVSETVIKFIQLPYNDLDNFRLDPEGVDGIILCHSIQNRRFAITDVMDALYDKFLPHASNVFGKGNIAVVVHDFAWPMTSDQSTSTTNHAEIKSSHVDSFRIRQPTTLRCSSLAVICGRLDSQLEMDEDDRLRLEKFVAGVRQDIQVPMPPFSGDNFTSQSHIEHSFRYLSPLLCVCMFVLHAEFSAIYTWVILFAVVLFSVSLKCLIWRVLIFKKQHAPFQGSAYDQVYVLSTAHNFTIFVSFLHPVLLVYSFVFHLNLSMVQTGVITCSLVFLLVLFEVLVRRVVAEMQHELFRGGGDKATVPVSSLTFLLSCLPPVLCVSTFAFCFEFSAMQILMIAPPIIYYMIPFEYWIWQVTVNRQCRLSGACSAASCDNPIPRNMVVFWLAPSFFWRRHIFSCL